MIRYRVVERLSADLVGVQSDPYGRQLMGRGKVRRMVACRNCGKNIQPGAEAYRTVNGSTMNRAHRVCLGCLS
jgi:ribosomal protein L32